MASRSDRVRFTILCEGYRDYYFIKAYLESAMGSRKVIWAHQKKCQLLLR